MTAATMTMERNTPVSHANDFLTVSIGGQSFGIPVLQVQDVLGPQKITQVPLAPRAVAGSLNLRGRIVTAVDVRACLGLEPFDRRSWPDMSVVVENNGELFSLMIDKVGDVVSLPYSDFEKNPPTLDPQWRNASHGIYRLPRGLLVVLDIPRLLDTINTKVS